MQILKPGLTKRVIIFGLSLSILTAAFLVVNQKFYLIPKSDKPQGEVAGTSTNPLSLDNKFCEDPATQSKCLSFIQDTLAHENTFAYQNVTGPVLISGALTQSGGYSYLGKFNSGNGGVAGGLPTRPEVSGGTGSPGLAVAWNYSAGLRDISLWNTDINNTTGTSFAFRQLTAADAHKDLVTIKSDGKIGIGTVNPLGPLSVGDSSISGSDGFIVIGKRTTGGTRHFRLGFNSDFKFIIGDYGNENTAGTWTEAFKMNWTTPANTLTLNKDSNNKSIVGIGTESVSNEINWDGALQVNGQIRAARIYDDDNRFYADLNAGGILGGTWTINGSTIQTSDIRWKKDIESLPSVLDSISRINGVKFNWKTEEFPDRYLPKEKQIGLIAQEIEKEFPELVTTGNDGYKSLNYSQFTAVLLEAIKEQQQQIDQLKKEVEELKNK